MIKSLLIWFICLFVAVLHTFAVEISADNINFKQKPKVSGGLTFNNTFYGGSDSLITRDPYLYTLSGNVDFNLFGVVLPFSFALSNTSRTYSQPFNRFQIAPKYKWARLYLGSTSMSFSPYTLAGRDFRGAGVELTPNKWFVGVMFGSFAKAVEYDPLAKNLDDVAYKRIGYSAKIGWTGDKTDVNATFFHAHDDVSSLEYYIPVESDLHPQRNSAISMYVRQKIAKWFFVQAEYAFSVYNSDIRTLEGEVAEGATFVSKFLGKKANDRYVDAFNGSFGYQGETWGLSFVYERIAPYYQTLGGYYFSDDREDFTFSPYFKLIDGKLSMNVRMGMERNNLNEMKANDNKRIVGSANVSYSNGNAFSAMASFSNFSNYTKYKKSAYPYYVDQLDTLNFYQVSRNLNAMLSYGVGDSSFSQSVSLSGAYQFCNSESGNESSGKQNVWSSTATYVQSISSANLNWGTFFSLNHVDMDNPNTNSLYWGPGINGGWHSKGGSVNTTVSIAYNQNINDGVRNSSLLNSNVGATWSIREINEKLGDHQLSTTIGLTNWMKSEARKDRNYELLATVNYSITF